ncbi:MAG: hypothetical protein ACP5SI_12865 [Chloroflexia bacterium]
MDEGPCVSPALSPEASERVRHPIPWRRILAGALAADVLFGFLLLLMPLWNGLVWVAGCVFFVVALWMGRTSDGPWRDGFLYGSAAALPACAEICLAGFPGNWALVLAFLLAWPQGMAGAWVGKKVWVAPYR